MRTVDEDLSFLRASGALSDVSTDIVLSARGLEDAVRLFGIYSRFFVREYEKCLHTGNDVEGELERFFRRLEARYCGKSSFTGVARIESFKMGYIRLYVHVKAGVHKEYISDGAVLRVSFDNADIKTDDSFLNEQLEYSFLQLSEKALKVLNKLFVNINSDLEREIVRLERDFDIVFEK